MLESSKTWGSQSKYTSSVGIEPTTSRLTVERANRLRHEDLYPVPRYTKKIGRMSRLQNEDPAEEHIENDFFLLEWIWTAMGAADWIAVNRGFLVQVEPLNNGFRVGMNQFYMVPKRYWTPCFATMLWIPSKSPH